MGSLEGFQIMASGRAKPFITLRDASITFSKSAIECLEYTGFVHMYVDEAGRRAAFQACEDDEKAFIFYQKPKPGRSMLVRLSGKKFSGKLMELAGIEKCDGGIRFYGEFVEEEKLLIFDMSKEGVRAE